VSKDVISKSQLFNGMLEDCIIDDEIIIDRSPKLFEHVYSYLLDDKYPYPKKYYSELDYYLVPYDIDLLYDPHKKCADKSERIEEEISKMKNIIHMALDKIVELLPTDPNQTCRYVDCTRERGQYLLTCRWHHEQCCHLLEDEDDFGRQKNCENGTYGAMIYCDEHIFDHRHEIW